jgi:hypothetical protein
VIAQKAFGFEHGFGTGGCFLFVVQMDVRRALGDLFQVQLMGLLP